MIRRTLIRFLEYLTRKFVRPDPYAVLAHKEDDDRRNSR